MQSQRRDHHRQIDPPSVPAREDLVWAGLSYVIEGDACGAARQARREELKWWESELAAGRPDT